MDLTQLANLGEFVGGVAVLVTLVYLALQVRQGTQNTNASNYFGLVHGMNELNAVVACDPAPGQLWLRGLNEPSSRSGSGAKPLAPTERKSRSLMVRFKPADYDELLEVAGETPPSEYVRDLVLRHLARKG